MEDHLRLDVRRWQRDGYLTPGKSFLWQWMRDEAPVASIVVRAESGRLILAYRHRWGDDDWTPEDYPVALSWTPCNYGGGRPWFRCPASGCGRRVAVLYLSRIFACRQCLRMAYRSQRETADGRATLRADKIRARLGWGPGILNDDGAKPKWMRWTTFGRLVAEHDAAVEASMFGMAHRLRLL